MQSHIDTIVILLAIFTISISFTPMDLFIANILKRYPSAKDMRKMKYMWLIVSVVTFMLLIYYVGITVYDGVRCLWLSIKPLGSPLWLNIIGPLGIFLVAAGLIYLLIWFIWSKVKWLIKQSEGIERIAYEIWEKEGRPNGHALEHWARAKTIWKELHEKKGKR